MNRLLFFARDPAGANVIIPVIKELLLNSQYEIIVYAKDFALERIRNEGIDAADICNVCDCITYDNIFDFVQKQNINGIITGTSLNDFTERYLWKSASQLGIYSCTIMDQWINFGIRFSPYDYSGEETYRENHIHPYLPARIIVLDQYIRSRMIEDGIQKELISVCGSPHFDTVIKKYQNAVQTFNEKEEVKKILFASEPVSIDYQLYWGFTEKTIFQSLYSCIVRLSNELDIKTEIIIRPHPREGEENWKHEILKYENDSISVQIDSKTDSFELMKNVDIVCGMSSMFLIESAICKVPIISILIGLKQESPFIYDRIGTYKSMMNESDLYNELRSLLMGSTQIIPFEIEWNATDKVITCIREDIENEHIGN